MKSVGLKDLKNKLSEYVRLAAAGETDVITDRNRVVAEIVPPRRKPESVIERGVRDGWIRPATRTGDWPPPRNPLKDYTLEQLLADLERPGKSVVTSPTNSGCPGCALRRCGGPAAPN